jgi:hypothetical protein
LGQHFPFPFPFPFLTPSECFRNAKREAASFNTTPPFWVAINYLVLQLQDIIVFNLNYYAKVYTQY